MSEQVRGLRARDLIRQFKTGGKRGAYWGIGSKIGDFPLTEQNLAAALVTDSQITKEISEMRTRLNKFSPTEQARLINWGYALADAGLRSRFDKAIADPAGLPCADCPI
jgi:NTE family protein